MKKLFYCASALLILAVVSSCSLPDNAIDEKTTTTISLDGVNYEADLIALFQGEVGQEVSLTLGVYDQFDIYGVDFGDGKIITDTVCFENRGLLGEDGKTKEGTTHTAATKFTGTVAGEGTLKVYGKSDVWYLITNGNVFPLGFDQEKLKNVVQVSISGAGVESIELPALEKMTQFSLTNVPVKSLDISKATELTSLSVIHTTTSPYEACPLATIDVSKNTKLTSLTLGNDFYKPGSLTSIDLTQNTALENVVISNNKISEVKLADTYENLTTFNASTNELKAINPAAMPNVKWFDVQKNQIEGALDITSEKLTNVYVNNNKLTGVKVPNVTKQFYFDNNEMTFATMPALPEGMNTTSKKKKFHYAPQADMTVAPDGAILDLSAQATAQGIEAEPQATVFTITAGNALLEADKDYKIENGVIEFLASQNDVVVKMTNAGFPDLTLSTLSFNVEVGGAAAGFFTFFEGNATGGSVIAAEGGKNSVGNEIKVASKKADIETDYVLITLDEPLKEGDIISMTGYRNKDNDANGNLYILFETGASIDEGSEVKWNNIHEKVGQEPNTNTYEVSAEAAGSKTIKLARSKSGTNVFIQKIEIAHQ